MAAAKSDRDAPVRQRSLRTHNLGLVLRTVAASPQPVSRADVAAATGLTKATVSTLVEELLAGSLLTEVEPAPRTGAGRPAVGLRLAAQGPAGLGLQVHEGNLAALGELHAGTEAAPSFLYISGEIGVGAGIVLDGRLMRGGRGFGGELGHVTIRPDGPRCRCGARGCLEAYANQETLLITAGLAGTDPITRLAAVARAGAPAALMSLEEAGTALGVAAANVVDLFDVDTVVLG